MTTIITDTSTNVTLTELATILQNREDRIIAEIIVVGIDFLINPIPAAIILIDVANIAMVTVSSMPEISTLMSAFLLPKDGLTR